MRALAAGLVAGLGLGCASPQPLEPGVRRHGLTWKVEVAPAMAQDCGSCHSGGEPAAGFRTDDYFHVIAKAHSGDPSSRLLAVQHDATHATLTSTFALLTTWVVDDDLGYETSPVHGPQLMNPAETTFHGTVAAVNLDWNLDSCAQCHGADFAGGTSGVTCQTRCHPGGLTSCTGCHGQPPATGAHEAHVTVAAIAEKLDCTECHVKPMAYTDAGHLKTGPATVQFGALASTPPASPTYAPSTQTCSGVYCHGGAFTDTAATVQAPAWNGGPSQAACGTCHGLPPSGHQGTGDQCVNCHRAVVDANGAIVDATKHVNGRVDFGAGTGTCTSCHGQPPATGSHVGHAQATHLLAAPVDCGDCHTVPATVDAPGHLTAVAEVVQTGVRATGNGSTQPTWNLQAGTCTNHCHGASQPTWGGGLDAIACGACHGIPPATSAHDPSLKLADCVHCHSATVGEGGAIKIGGAHMNGVVDVED
jgi:predicted CxxxxCH...CXXCH cytochrome family protein